MFRPTGTVLFALSILLGLSTAANSSSRGLTVPLKASSDENAAVVEEVELYHNSFALVIGIDDYTAGWPRLSNAVKDAKLIAAGLERQGFQVSLKLNLTSRELDRALEEFFIVTGEDPDARLFVWFAGHGHTENGEGYLIPADAPKPQVGARFRVKALSLRRIGEYVRQAQAKHAFAVFDSCFSGTVFESARALPPAAITAATTQPVRQFLTSGDAGQTVSDDGTFRELFLRVLNGRESADANRDGYVTASEIGLFLSDRVTNLTESKQTPRYGKLRDKDFDRGDFVFRLASTDSSQALSATQGRNEQEGLRQETLFWESIKDTAEPEAFEAYLAQFPNGTFAALARVKLDAAARKRREAALEREQLKAERNRLEAERKRLAAETEKRLVEERARLAAERERLQREQSALAVARQTQSASLAPRGREGMRPAVPAEPAEIVLPPADYLALPPRTEVRYDTWSYRVQSEDDRERELRLGDGNLWAGHGAFIVLGEGYYSIVPNAWSPTSAPPTPTMTTAEQAKLSGLWPLSVGKSAEVTIAEPLADNAAWHDGDADEWRLKLKVLRAESISAAGRRFNTYVVETTAASALGREYRELQWYHPNSGLVIKSEREWRGKQHPQARRGTRPGDIESYTLESARFPRNAANALNN